MWESLPEFGTGVLYAILVCAAYTFAVAVAAGRGRPRLLESARLGAYGTAALVLLGVLLLAYAFVTHDFRIRYVARYSDRSMTTGYLITSLWGGQDGSLLWWLFLLSGYVTACVWWLKGKYRLLQPYVIATLMVIMGFFAVLMLYSANPFETSIAGARVDGEGLNPLLRNYYMIIHPPSLYMGFVGCSVPFSFAVAALVTGRLDSEWINAVRKWMLFAWLFLSIGNALGMKWAYEELGWGGYWAWDPVENAACLPWFAASAYVHSTMIQERRNMLKVWNVSLICLTFFLTIFGTFLTRSGMISSVHSFAQSDIGVYFVGFMGLILAASAGLIVWRLPLLRAQGRIESLLSREMAFVFNNWALLGATVFIGVATTWPLFTELFTGHEATVGPPFYNRWMMPIGLTLLFLMGVAPLFGWRKTSEVSLRQAFRLPSIVMLVVVALHIAFGASLGFPAYVEDPPSFSGVVGAVVQKLAAIAPVVTVGLISFNFGVIFQEFQRGVRARRKNASENVFEALFTLVKKSRRRYGGYIVHAGIGLMFLGFCGKAWEVEKEASMLPGEKAEVGRYTLTYKGSRMDLDQEKRMIFADLDVERDGKSIGQVNPAKFIYNRSSMGPTTEVSQMNGLRDDLYVVVGVVSPDSKRATFRFHVNPLVAWIWIGVLVLISGTMVSLWPEVSLREVGAWSYVRGAAGATSGVMLSIFLASSPARAMTGPPSTAAPEYRVAALSDAPAKPIPPAPAGLDLGVAAAIALGLGGGALSSRRRRKGEERATGARVTDNAPADEPPASIDTAGQ
jgi:cytochrome c-type biogenesis protein CcmF